MWAPGKGLPCPSMTYLDIYLSDWVTLRPPPAPSAQGRPPTGQPAAPSKSPRRRPVPHDPPTGLGAAPPGPRGAPARLQAGSRPPPHQDPSGNWPTPRARRRQAPPGSPPPGHGTPARPPPRPRPPGGVAPEGGVKGFPRDALSFQTARPTGKPWGRLAPRPRRPGRPQSPPRPPRGGHRLPDPRGPLYATATATATATGGPRPRPRGRPQRPAPIDSPAWVAPLSCRQSFRCPKVAGGEQF